MQECLVRRVSHPSPVHTALLYLEGSLVLERAIALPLALYSTFVTESKHGFNRQSLGLFLADQCKSLTLVLTIGAPAVLALSWLLDAGGRAAFLYIWVLCPAAGADPLLRGHCANLWQLHSPGG